jgi:hypothetical protein
MECTECGDGDANPMRVEYVQGPTETLRLCAGCRQEYEEGNFVEDVTLVGSRGDGS